MSHFTETNLKNRINQLLADNTTGNISESIMRDILKSVYDSIVALKEYNPAKEYLVGETCLNAGDICVCTSDTTGVFVPGDWDVIISSSALNTSLNNLSNLSAGCVTDPDWDWSSPTLTVNAQSVALHSVASGASPIVKYLIAQTDVVLIDNSNNYIIADYNGGTPIIRTTLNVEEINETTIVPILTIYREGSDIHKLSWDKMGVSLLNKLHQRLVKTRRFERESGLAIGELPTRIVTLTEGKMWYGAVRSTLGAFNSNNDTLYQYNHVAGVWTKSVVTQYNNLQYDDGTDLQTLGTGRYAVCWIYRGVEVDNHCYLVLGTANYTLAQAQDAKIPAIPDIISKHAVLVGKIVVQKSAAVATEIDSAFESNFSVAEIVNHNDISNRDEASCHPATAVSVVDDFTGNLAGKSVTNVALLATAVDELSAGSTGIPNVQVSKTYNASGFVLTDIESLGGSDTIERRYRYYDPATNSGSIDIMEVKNTKASKWVRVTFVYTAGRQTSTSHANITEWTI
jgi:hypothetical protein